VANSFVDVIRLVEAHVPQARGGTSYDDVLRASLVGFANTVIDEIDREQRWSLSYAEPYFTTVQGTEQYALPYPLPASALGQTSQLFIKRVYYVDATGRPVALGRVDQYEAQRLYGESLGLGASATAPPQGKPTKYAIIPSTSTAGGIDQGNPQMTIFLYPTPDASGPETSGNFKIRVQGYWKTPPIWETLAATASNTTLTFTVAGSGSYLTSNGVATNGSQWNLFLAVRNGGNPTGITQFPNDTHISTWTALAANTATISTAAPTSTASLTVYFNGTNWIIQHWPRLLVYGIMKEIGNYYNKSEMFAVWEAKFQQQLDALRAYEWDRARGVELLMSAVAGQSGSPFRVNDLQSFLDIRGGGGW
jgi:hypothetical protein